MAIAIAFSSASSAASSNVTLHCRDKLQSCVSRALHAETGAGNSIYPHCRSCGTGVESQNELPTIDRSFFARELMIGKRIFRVTERQQRGALAFRVPRGQYCITCFFFREKMLHRFEKGMCCVERKK